MTLNAYSFVAVPDFPYSYTRAWFYNVRVDVYEGELNFRTRAALLGNHPQHLCNLEHTDWRLLTLSTASLPLLTAGEHLFTAFIFHMKKKERYENHDGLRINNTLKANDRNKRLARSDCTTLAHPHQFEACGKQMKGAFFFC